MLIAVISMSILSLDNVQSYVLHIWSIMEMYITNLIKHEWELKFLLLD